MKLLIFILSILFTTQALAADLETLYIAASRGDYTTIKHWIIAGNDINTSDKHGNSALLLASENGYADTVQLLVDNGANLDLMNAQGYTPLYSAVVNAYPDVIDILYIGGAKGNVKNQYRSTAIDYIKASGYKDVNSYVAALRLNEKSLKTGPNSYLYLKAWEKKRLALLEAGKVDESLLVMTQAAKIDADAQYYLALHLLEEGDEAEAMAFMAKAAEGGVVDAKYRAGIYMIDEANQANPVQGLVYLQEAADAGHVEAISAVGYCYLFGIGTPIDLEIAHQYIGQAAGYGDVDALFYQAIMLYYGMGEPEDKVKGAEMMQELAKAGNVKAKRQLDRIFTEEVLDKLSYVTDLTPAQVRTYLLSQGAVEVEKADDCDKYDVSRIFDADYGISAVSACFYENKPGSLAFDVRQEMSPLYREWLINYQMKVPVRYDLK